MPGTSQVLAAGRRCMLAVSGRQGPVLSPMAYWSDGRALWLSAPGDSVKSEVLRRDDHAAVFVAGADPDTPGAVAIGRARVFSLGDPFGLALHAPALAGAVAALALRNADAIAGYLADAARVPARFLPTGRVVLRLVPDRVDPAPVPVLGTGIAPALPPVVPAEVRRTLAGLRRVVVATDRGGLALAPAVWGPGMTLIVSEGVQLPVGAPAAVALDAQPDQRPTSAAGLSLSGTLTAGPALRPERLTWWQGFTLRTVEGPFASAAAGGAALPD